jgi:hypothetical protein
LSKETFSLLIDAELQPYVFIAILGSISFFRV